MDVPFKSLEHPTGISVELLGYLGNDLEIVNAARASFGKESQWEYWGYDPTLKLFVKYEDSLNHAVEWHPCLSTRDSGVLNYMMREEHGTPFEMVQFKFKIHAPIGVVWEWVRHRISSFNVKSTRYVVMAREFYIPLLEQVRRQVGKPGHYQFETLTPIEAQEILDIYINSLHNSYDAYELLIEKGLAKEVARNVLPMGLYTDFVWSVNLRSLFNFLHLRTAPNALYEIQVPAYMVEELASQIVPEAFNTWRRNGKKAP